MKRLYLAGPDVFLPDAATIGAAKVALAQRFGFEGLFPLDSEVAFADDEAPGPAIYRANVALMRTADAIVANLTPFRGPSADVGTAFELGFFAAMEKPIFAYSSDPRSVIERTRALLGLPDDAVADAEGSAIEDFRLPDNLMLPGAVAAAGGSWIARAAPPGKELAAFEAFEECLERIAAANRSPIPAAAAG